MSPYSCTVIGLCMIENTYLLLLYCTIYPYKSAAHQLMTSLRISTAIISMYLFHSISISSYVIVITQDEYDILAIT